jgi:hypothetical protein
MSSQPAVVCICTWMVTAQAARIRRGTCSFSSRASPRRCSSALLTMAILRMARLLEALLLGDLRGRLHLAARDEESRGLELMHVAIKLVRVRIGVRAGLRRGLEPGPGLGTGLEVAPHRVISRHLVDELVVVNEAVVRDVPRAIVARAIVNPAAVAVAVAVAVALVVVLLPLLPAALAPRRAIRIHRLRVAWVSKVTMSGVGTD